MVKKAILIYNTYSNDDDDNINNNNNNNNNNHNNNHNSNNNKNGYSIKPTTLHIIIANR